MPVIKLLKKIRNFLKRFLGKILPKSYHVFFSDKNGFLIEIIRNELNRLYYSKADEEMKRFNREKLWGSETAAKWHAQKRKEGRSKAFLKFRTPLVFQISKLTGLHTICEIGTGNGMFLEYLSEQVPNIKRFVGIDLCKPQILENREIYKNTKLEFIYGEVTDWINTCENGTIFVSDGTFEYFTQKELQELVDFIYAKVNPTAIAIAEPTNLNLATEIISKPRKNIAYSHNYLYLFSKYQVVYQQIESVNKICKEVIMVVKNT